MVHFSEHNNRAYYGFNFAGSGFAGGEDKVNAPSAVVANMLDRWRDVDTLRSHTEGMRRAAERFLPQWAGEELRDYEARLERSFLFEAYDHGVDMVASRPFSKPVTLHPELPGSLAGMIENADASGTSFHDIAQTVMDSSIHYGVTHVLTQFPQTKTSPNDPPITLRDTKTRGIRPYFVHIPAPQVLDFIPEVVDGRLSLSELRYLDVEEKKTGEWGKTATPIVWVWRRDSIRKYVEVELKGEEVEFRLSATFPNTLGRIPLNTFYTRRTGFMLGEPAMGALADKNVEHWQKSSDLNGLEAFASVGVWFIKGITDTEAKKLPKTLKGNTRIVLSSTQAEMKTVEHSGSAIRILRDGIAKIEDQMMVLALQPFVADKGGDAKATGIAISESKGNSQVQRWVRGHELNWRKCFQDAAEWQNAALPEGFAVNIHSNFLISLTGSQVLERVRQVRADGEIDRETFLRIMSKLGDIPEEISVEEIMTRLDEEPDKNPEPVKSDSAPVQATSQESDSN